MRAAQGVDFSLRLHGLAKYASKFGVPQGFPADRGIRAAGMVGRLMQVAADRD